MIIPRRSTWIVLLLCVLVGVSLVSAVGASAALGQDETAGPTNGKVVVKIGWMGQIDSLNPFIGWTMEAYEVYSNQYLLFVGRDWETLEPDDLGIVKSWDVSEDGLVWTFTINEGVTWQDGEPVTAADAAFTYNFILENDIPSMIHQLTGVERAEVVDDLTFRVICSRPVASMLRLWIYCLPEHIWGKMSAEEASLTFENSPPSVGNGPFQVVEYKPDQYLRMQAYDDFYLGRAKPDEVMFVVYQNGDTMVQDFKSGALDAIYLFPPAQFDELKAAEGIEVVEYTWYNWDHIGFNCYEGKSKGHPALRDKRFRSALEYAVDREKLVELAYGGHGIPGYTFMPPGAWSDPDYAWAPDDTQRRDYDPDKASQMFDAAGYTDSDGDGIREYEGKNIKLRLWALTESPESQRAVKLIAGWWEAVGVDVALSVQDQGVYFDNIWGYEGDTFVPDFDAYYWYWDGYYDPGLTLASFTTEQIENSNEFAWSNAEFDRLNVLQSKELDEVKRAEYIQSMQQVMYDDAPCIVTLHPLKLQAYRTDKWDGWTQCGNGEGPAFLTQSLTWAYYDLTPKVAEEDESQLGLWVGIIVVSVAVVGVVAWLTVRRRRGAPAMDE